MRSSSTTRRSALLSLAMLVLGPGCADMGHRLPTAPEPAPVPSTPQQAMRLLEWCWNNRDLSRYRELLAEDFQFVFSQLDPSGNPYRGLPWNREDELASIGHLFVGGNNTLSPADHILLVLDPNFRVRSDPRPGKHPKWHKTVRSGLVLDVRTQGGEQFHATGFSVFYLVRGDSASIPLDLAGHGVRPDSTRWYLERWEDETAGSFGLQAFPTKTLTLGGLKALYR